MSSNYIILKDEITNIVKDESGKLLDNDIDRYMLFAIRTYSRSRPDIAVVDITGDGGHDYALPSSWVDGFSRIMIIEYPIGDIPAQYLDEDDYCIYQNETTKLLRLLYDSPSASNDFRVVFSIPRTDSTIPDNDIDAVCNLAASYCLEQLANAYAQTSDSTISADSVDYRSKSYEFAQRAKRHIAIYKEHMGIKEGDTVAAATGIVNLDWKYPYGMDRLTHPKWARDLR